MKKKKKKTPNHSNSYFFLLCLKVEQWNVRWYVITFNKIYRTTANFITNGSEYIYFFVSFETNRKEEIINGHWLTTRKVIERLWNAFNVSFCLNFLCTFFLFFSSFQFVYLVFSVFFGLSLLLLFFFEKYKQSEHEVGLRAPRCRISNLLMWARFGLCFALSRQHYSGYLPLNIFSVFLHRAASSFAVHRMHCTHFSFIHRKKRWANENEARESYGCRSPDGSHTAWLERLSVILL